MLEKISFPALPGKLDRSTCILLHPCTKYIYKRMRNFSCSVTGEQLCHRHWGKRVVKPWSRLPRRVVESACLQVFKNVGMWHLRRWFSGGHGGGAGLAAGLDDSRDLVIPGTWWFQGPDDSRDLMILSLPMLWFQDSAPLGDGYGGLFLGTGWGTSGTMLGLPVGQQVKAGVLSSHVGVSLHWYWNFPP